MQHSKLNWFPNAAIIFILMAAMGFKFWTTAWQKKVIEHDVISYYAYLPATFIHHDIALGFMNNPDSNYYDRFWPNKLENGNYVIKTSMGMSMLYAPFFGMAHAYEKATGGKANGFTSAYRTGISFAALLYLLLGLIMTRKLLRKYFSPLVTGITLLLIVLGTNLFHYATREAGMSHVYSFGLIALFLYINDKWLNKTSTKNSIFVGLLFGIITLVRPTNGLIVIFPLLWNVVSWKQFKDRVGLLSKNWLKIVVVAIASLIVWLPQLLYWKMQTGHFFYNSYGESFFFDSFHHLDALFGYRKGWYLYTPIMLVATIGIFFLRKETKTLRFSILVFLIVFIYITFSWWCWWYGGSYSSRPMVDIYSVMALPLAAIVAALANRGTIAKSIVIFVAIVFISFSYFQTYQYKLGLIHYDSMTKKSYWNIFGKSNPTITFYQLLQTPDYDNAFIGNDEVFPEITETLSIDPNDYYFEGTNLNCEKNTEYFNLVNIVIPDTIFNTSGTIVIPQCESNTFGNDLEITASLYSPQGEVLWFTSSNISAATSYGGETMRWDFPLNMTDFRSDSLNIKIFFRSIDKSGFTLKEVKVLIKGIKSYCKDKY